MAGRIVIVQGAIGPYIAVCSRWLDSTHHVRMVAGALREGGDGCGHGRLVRRAGGPAGGAAHWSGEGGDRRAGGRGWTGAGSLARRRAGAAPRGGAVRRP